MQKTVQIPRKLFLELVKYHLGEVPADEILIKTELQKKLNSMAAREKYTRALANKKEQNYDL